MCDIGPISQRLLHSVHKSLAKDGLVVVVDRFLSADGTQPLDRLVEHFAGSSFGVTTWTEMVQALESGGFQQVKAEKIYRDVWCITGVKSRRRKAR